MRNYIQNGYLNVQAKLANTLKPLQTLELFLLVYLNTIERKNYQHQLKLQNHKKNKLNLTMMVKVQEAYSACMGTNGKN